MVASMNDVYSTVIQRLIKVGSASEYIVGVKKQPPDSLCLHRTQGISPQASLLVIVTFICSCSVAP